MALEIKLPVFEGPLDLLLHLIEKNKVDIYDIPIVTITEQYLDYIRQLESADMEIMSEFLVMAATLLDIKCRMLLPAGSDADGEAEDPRTWLVQKLLEYKMYKFMSYELQGREVAAARALYRPQRLPPEVAAYEPPIDYDAALGDATTELLSELLRAMLKRQEDKIDRQHAGFGEVARDTFDMEKRMVYVEAYLAGHQRFRFRELLERAGSKREIIVTFLVVLELIRMGRVEVAQDSIDGEITITSRDFLSQ
jgi:segregation and condensation protein A